MKTYYIYIIGVILFSAMFMYFSLESNYNNQFNITDENYEIKEYFNLSTISVSKFKEKLITNEYILIDIRTEGELYDTGVIGSPINLDFYGDMYKSSLISLDKNKKYLIYCRSGNRTGQTLEIMKTMGFKEVYDLDGGIVNWLNKGEKLISYKK